MSDDIPLIFANQLLAPDAHGPRAVFLSAATTSQMQQYATAGWRVFACPGFQAVGQVDLGAVPAQAADDTHAQSADIISIEGQFWSPDTRAQLERWRANIVKVNFAFHNLEDASCEKIAGTIAGLGYTLLAAHWRDDNTYGFGSVSRLDYLAGFEPRDWKHLNLIAVREPAHARTLIVVGRLYVGEERRIAELRLANAVRGDHIARLEDALMARLRRA